MLWYSMMNGPPCRPFILILSPNQIRDFHKYERFSKGETYTMNILNDQIFDILRLVYGIFLLLLPVISIAGLVIFGRGIFWGRKADRIVYPSKLTHSLDIPDHCPKCGCDFTARPPRKRFEKYCSSKISLFCRDCRYKWEVYCLDRPKKGLSDKEKLYLWLERNNIDDHHLLVEWMIMNGAAREVLRVQAEMVKDRPPFPEPNSYRILNEAKDEVLKYRMYGKSPLVHTVEDLDDGKDNDHAH